MCRRFQVDDELGCQKWYVGDTSRQSAESMVKSSSKDGAFVVRQSRKGGVSNPLTITLIYAGQVYNLHIRRRPDDKFAIGKEKAGEIVSFFTHGTPSVGRNMYGSMFTVW